jgi:hypothetical protein
MSKRKQLISHGLLENPSEGEPEDDQVQDEETGINLEQTQDTASDGVLTTQEGHVETENPTIEEHAATLGTPAWALAGTKVRERWVAQQRVTRTQFEGAVERFLSGPTDGPGRKGGE